MNDILKQIENYGIVPVIKIDDATNAVPLAKALCDGGLPVAEVTFRTQAAKESIKRISKELPNMLLGAGTVLATTQVDEAIEAGAKFIVSPGLNKTVVKYCIDKNIPITPGCANPSDVEMAIELGLDVVKFFPAEAAGGIKMIKAMSAPYVNMKFMPTGGINATNLNDYLSFDKIIACGGSWMVSDALINEKNFEKITVLTKQAVQTMLGFELIHIGINTDSKDSGVNIANTFEKLFGFTTEVGNSSAFAGVPIEVMFKKGYGTSGHIAIGTNNVTRAYSYLKNMGIEFTDESKVFDEKNNLKLIYLKEEVGGFAIHLVKK